MYIYNKIIELPSPPNSHDVLWINSNNGQLYVFLNNKWLSLSATSNEFKLDKYDIKLKTNRKNITDSINELFDIIKDIENHYGDINIEDIAKLQTLLECTGAILLYIEQLRLQLESTAKEDTLAQVASKVQEESAAIQNKIDNIKLPEIDTTELAKQGENQEATNSAILSALNDVAASMYKGVPIVSQTGDATISPNVLNVWTAPITNLTISKGVGIDNIVNIYLVRFSVSGTASIAFSGFELKWQKEPSYKDGKTYEISIIDNYATCTEF